MNTPIQTLSGIEDFVDLKKINLSYVADGDLRPLLDLPNLKEVYLGEALRQAAEEELKDATFTIIYSS